MSDKELREYLARMDAFKKRLSTDPKIARDFLKSAGILTENGHFKKPFRNLRSDLEKSLSKK
jgi:hypothetical protein